VIIDKLEAYENLNDYLLWEKYSSRFLYNPSPGWRKRKGKSFSFSHS
jgi:hypothetical protein